MIDYLVAATVASICLAIGLPAIPQLWREVIFYRKNQWDFHRESPNEILVQEEWERRFSLLPVGAIKILYHLNRIALMLIVVIPLGIGAYRAMK